MDPGARLRARRHGRPARPQTGDRRGRSASPWAWSPPAPSTGRGCPPTGSTRWRRSRSPALSFGLAEVAHGSGFLAVYLTALALGSARIPARRTIVAFHEGVGWVAQIGLFILLGLLVFPSTLGDVALEGLALSAVLIFVARPLAAFVATSLAPLELRERAMLELGRAARRDADLAGHLPGRRRGRRR